MKLRLGYLFNCIIRLFTHKSILLGILLLQTVFLSAQAISISDVTQAEGTAGTSTFTFTVSIDGGIPDASDITFSVNTQDGTATAGTDYTALSGATGTILAGATSTNVEVVVNGDADFEADETFSVVISDVSVGSITDDTGTGTITNDDLPTASISATDAAAAEVGADTGTFTVSLNATNNSGSPIIVDYTVGGTATSGTDYTALSGTVEIADGSSSGTITVSPINDTDFEGDETVIVTLAAGTGYEVGTPLSATVTISSDDNASLTIANVSALESAGNLVFSVTLNNAVTGGTEVSYTFADGTALNGTDFTGTNGTLTFVGTVNEVQTINVPLNNDAILEGDETFTVTLGIPTNGVGISGSPATGTITDDDTAAITITNVSAAESDGNMVFAVSLDNAVAAGTSVTYAITDVTALNGTDYTATDGTLTFTGTAGEIQNITVAITEDAILEGNETFTITLGTPTNAVTTNGSPAAGTITDNDTATLTISNVNVAENAAGGQMVFPVTLNNAVAAGTSVTYSFTDVTAINGTDYTGTNGTLTFAGTAGEQQNITVTLNNDAILEGTETFTVTLGTPTNGVTAVGSPATGTITDDDSATLSISDVTVAENVAGGSMSFTVTLNNVVAGGTQVAYTFTDGTALNGIDYTGTAGTLTFLGTSGEQQTIVVPIINEAIVEGAETFTLVLGTPTNGVITSGSPATGTITNDDSVIVSFSSLVYSDNEGAGGNLPALFITGTVTAATTVTVSVLGGTATGGGVDYTFTTPQQITIPAGSYDGTVATQLFLPGFSIVDEALVEGAETVIFGLSLPTGDATLGGIASAAYTIINDDSVSVTFATSATSDTEASGGNLPVIRVNGSVSTTSTVTVSSIGGTALLGTDYTLNSPQVVTIPIGEYDGTAATEIAIPGFAIIDEGIVENNETLILSLSSPTGVATLGSITATTYTILNDDAVTASFAAVESSDDENTGGNLPAIRINGTVTAGSTVTVSITGGTATSGTDYAFVSPQVITIPAGVYDGTAATQIPIPNLTITNDAVVEGDETIIFTMSAPTGDIGLIAPVVSTYTILDTDTSSITVADFTVAENVAGGQLLLNLSLGSPVSGGLQVNYSFEDGTATGGGVDYIAAPGTLNFSGAPGQILSIPIQIVNDAVAELSEDFSVVFQVSNSRVTLSQNVSVITIQNDDPNRISIADLTLSEGNSGTTAFDFTVSVQAGSQALQNISFNYGTTAGSASNNSDFVPVVQGTGTITAGATSTTVRVLVNGDSDVESNENFIVTLSNPTGGQILDGTAIGTIQNDDQCDAGDLAPTRNVNQQLDFCSADIIPSLSNFVSGTPQLNNVLVFTRNEDLLDEAGYLTEQDIAAPSTGTYYAFYLDPINLCASPALTLTLVRNVTPVITNFVEDDRCGPGEVILQASGNVPGLSNIPEIRWYTAAQGGSLISTGAVFIANITQTTSYWVEAFSNGCGSVRQEVRGIVIPPATTGVATDGFACSVSDNGITIRDLDDQLLGADAGVWTIQSVPAQANIIITPGNIVNFVGQPAGEYVFRYTTNSAQAPCTNTSVLVTISVTDCDVDSDGDGLLDGVEEILGTNPLLTDTDGDGINDGTEVGSDILNAIDTDGDGKIDALESNLLDSDGDNVSDQQDPEDEDPCVPNPASGLCGIDLEVVKTADKSQASYGEQVTFTITLNNLSETPGFDIKVGELLQSGFQYISHSTSAGQFNLGTGIWSLSEIAGSGTETLQITVAVQVIGDYFNTAELLDSVPVDKNPSNDSSTVSIDTEQFTDADLEVTQTVQIAPSGNPSDSQINALAGNQVVFLITVTNLSESITVDGIQVEQFLDDSGFDYQQHTFPLGSFAPSAYNRLTGIWNVGTLAPGESAQMSIVANLIDSGTFSNIVRLANPQDANQNNDVANVRVVVADQSGYAAGFVFNLFSPNGDGINDKVKIKLSQTNTLTGLEEQVITSYNIQIFNRYGQLIYEGLNLSNAEAWDGSFNGAEAPSGTYFYVLTYQKGTEEGSLEVTDKGWIQLIR